jgi:hypothetical protein
VEATVERRGRGGQGLPLTFTLCEKEKKQMNKIEYLFYCAVLNGAVFLGELIILYLSAKSNIETNCKINGSLIAMWAAEGVALLAWLINCCCAKCKNKHGKPDDPTKSNSVSNSEAQSFTKTAEAKAIAVAKVSQCTEENEK